MRITQSDKNQGEEIFDSHVVLIRARWQCDMFFFGQVYSAAANGGSNWRCISPVIRPSGSY